MEFSREDALTLLHEQTKSTNLRKHALAVEAGMQWYAEYFDEDVEKWRIVGLLHDMDYEKHPTKDEHPFVGVEILRDHGYPEEITRAILSHADYTGVSRETLMEKTLYAVDELSGFIVAVALVRPNGIGDMKVKSVTKKLKQSSFAASVDRDAIRAGADDLGINLNDHIRHVIEALQSVREDLEI
ncbi:MAG: HDIG domain-containing protein [Candidatus Marinimicrobia bacterium]|nr:HDIG domain-containing protein [Candidatus Neomarinimicrobiota bacterium]MCF7880602.1 HDIG domain-containing protein [Candidatus Neomarinimicrobiota bacterium]